MQLKSQFNLTFIGLFILVSPALKSSWALEVLAQPSTLICTPSREFITTLEYLKAHQLQLAIPELEAEKIALQTAENCTGGAQRFIKVTNSLQRAGLSSRDAINNGLKFSLKSNTEADTFVSVFTQAFLSDALDLDLQSAVVLAQGLSSEFDGDKDRVRQDFTQLVNFCLNTRELDLPKLKCALMASELVKKSNHFVSSMSKEWIRLFNFLTQKENTNLASFQALKLMESLLPAGTGFSENFIQAFQYAVSTNGLKLPVLEALKFAENLTLKAKAQ